MFISFYLVQSKHIKMHSEEISPINFIVFQFFCIFSYSDKMFYFHKKFQVASSYDAKLESLAIV